MVYLDIRQIAVFVKTHCVEFDKLKFFQNVSRLQKRVGVKPQKTLITMLARQALVLSELSKSQFFNNNRGHACFDSCLQFTEVSAQSMVCELLDILLDSF